MSIVWEKLKIGNKWDEEHVLWACDPMMNEGQLVGIIKESRFVMVNGLIGTTSCGMMTDDDDVMMVLLFCR